MNKTSTFFTVLIVFLSACIASGQNNKQVLLSDKVGFVIDKSEKTQYQLFYKIKGFIEASFYLDTNGSYFSDIQYEDKDKLKKDTLIYFTEKDIIKIAEQIQFFDEIQKGTHSFGDVTPTITTINNVVYIVLKEEIRKKITDIKPYDKKPVHYYEFPKSKHMAENNFPDFGLGYSMAYSNIDFSPVTSFVDYTENYLITQGFNVVKYNPSIEPSPISIINVYIKLKKELGLSAEIGLSKTEKFFNFHSTSLYLQYHLNVKNLEELKPHIAIGITSCRYTVSFHHYDMNQNGTQYLEEIKSEGGSFGITVNCGINLQLMKLSESSSIVLDIFGKYAFIKKQKSEEFHGYSMTLELSNFSFGTGLKIYY
jgi:hypothetical protein